MVVMPIRLRAVIMVIMQRVKTMVRMAVVVMVIGDNDEIKMPESSGVAPSRATPRLSYGRQRGLPGSPIPSPSHSGPASHPTPRGSPRYEIRVLGYDLMQAMRFAGEEINSQSSLLPGVLLGYEMVAVGRTSNDVQPVLHFPAKEDCSLPIQEDYSHWVPRAVAVLGPGNSESTVTVARFLSLLLLPQGRPLGPGVRSWGAEEWLSRGLTSPHRSWG